MTTNRDISIAVIQAYGEQLCEEQTKKGQTFEGLSIFEGLSATGIRTCRYAQELSPNLVKFIHANDLDEHACHLIQENLDLNGISDQEVCITQGDCNLVLAHHASDNLHFLQYQVIDIDPYGCPSTFFGPAIKAIKDGGLLCITCTDLSTLCGAEALACNRKYGAMPIHDPVQHEHALRIVLYTLSQIAGIHSSSIEPLLSMYIDYYLRIFVRVCKSKKVANNACSNISNVFYCYKCGTLESECVVNDANAIANSNVNVNEAEIRWIAGKHSVSVCQLCQSKYRKFGPCFTGALHHKNFVERVLKVLQTNKSFTPTFERLFCKLQIIKSELPHCPYFIVHNHVCSKIKCQQMKNEVFRSAIENCGYQWSLTHCTPEGTKTNAPLNNH